MGYPVLYVPAGDVIPVMFSSYAGATGASVTLTGLAVTDIEIYKDGSTTQRASDAGYVLLDTDGIDFDAITGIHGFSIDTGDNTDAGFYTVGAWFTVVVSAVTIDSQTVNFIAAMFRIMPAESVAGKPKVDVDAWLGTAASTPTVAGVPNVNVKTWNDLTTVALPLIPTVAGRTLDVSAGGEAGLDWANVGTQSTAVNLSATTVNLTNTVTTYTGNTVQTGDNFARLGAPAGASVSADIAAVKVDTAAVKVKTDFLPSVTAGAAGGVFIAGSNAATTAADLTITGAFTISDGIIVTCSTTNRSGMNITGNGTGSGLALTGGATGAGLLSRGGATSGVGGSFQAQASASRGLQLIGSGGGQGLYSIGGSSGDGVYFSGGGVSGAGLQITNTTGDAVIITAIAGNGDAIQLTGHGTGTGLRSDIIGSITGNLSGTIGGLTAAALKDFFDTDSGTTYASAVAGSVVAETANNASATSVAAIKAKTDQLTFTTANQVDATTVTVSAAAIGTGDISSAALNEIADAILDRNMATGTDSGSTTVRTPRQALRSARNRVAISAGTATIYKEDDSTASWTAVVTTTAGNPISEVDPAGP